MNNSRSLSLRLVVYLLTVLFLGSSTAWFIAMSLSLAGIAGSVYLELNDFASESTRHLVTASITRAPDGALYLEPTAALRVQVARMPNLHFAVIEPDSGATLPGSSAELSAVLGGKSRMKIGFVSFKIVGDSRPDLSGFAWEERTAFGPMLVVAYGYEFLWIDAPRYLFDVLRSTTVYSVPLFAFAAAIVWFAVRQGLSPLREAASEVQRIDIDTLDQRLPENLLPVEVTPFVAAVNDALERLDAGVARERRFMANAAHELRTPIAILFARMDNPQNESLRRDLTRHLTQLHNIVEQLLISARLAKGKVLRNETIDLAAVVLSKVADYAPLLRENGRHVEYDGPLSAVMIRGDRHALESILANLLDNALRAEPVGGTVVVRLKPGASLEVVDHGEGVAPDDRETIFEPFWRKSEATPGTGLGLAIVKELVELHGGKISIEETPGSGATFKLSFPRMNSN